MTDVMAEHVAMATPQPGPALSALRGKILSQHSERPQAKGLAMVALEALERALSDLGMLGHRIVVDFAAPVAPVEFPKMLYAGRGVEMVERVVEHAAEEAEALAAGWRKTQHEVAVAPKAAAPLPPTAPTITIPTTPVAGDPV